MQCVIVLSIVILLARLLLEFLIKYQYQYDYWKPRAESLYDDGGAITGASKRFCGRAYYTNCS